LLSPILHYQQTVIVTDGIAQRVYDDSDAVVDVSVEHVDV